MRRRLKATIEYDGTHFSGWQVQKNGRTVQGEIQSVLSKRYNEKIKINGSGRTDTGVHATGQVADFMCPEEEQLEKLKKSINGMLPDDICFTKLEYVEDDFHSRFDAIGRTYEYKIHKGHTALERNYCWTILQDLDVQKMHGACYYLLGTHDFFPMSKINPEYEHYRCTVFHAEVKKFGKHIVFTIRANRFLHGMVRAIMGTLADVGRENKPVDIFNRIITEKDRALVSALAPAKGLYLTRVNY